MQKLIPGLLDNAFEFFNLEDDLKFVSDGKLKSFTEAPASVIIMLKEAIDKNPEAKAILIEWHPESEFNQLKQFASCKFGGIDYSADIKDGQLQEGEYWKCPKAGSCVGEGVICTSPIYNGHVLSKTEIELIRLSTTEKTNEAIAEELNLPMGTFHKYKHTLYEKLGFIQTKQCLTKIAYSLNII
ncbi:MAG: LuxR C-terminal-related transcriptional regulator [Flavobacterium sp.]|uniref:helix-turn-helix transcriptional regulator n=1 Tax=Flavobacterium sp. TaxID=239 RepID=UPI0025B7D427|nr:LuxR C-terminal-related transcriptional regulator [Flavobacterium sp.]MCA1966959.1 LuxR C-terminal-related transcriptional regulator [Flavobacterium sp.]